MKRLHKGLAARITAAVFGMATLTFGVITVAGLGFSHYGQMLEQVLESYLPTLAAGSQLAQLSQSMAANAPALMTAETQAARSAVAQRLEEQARSVDLLIGWLAASGGSTADIGDLRVTLASLVEQLRTLDRAVAERMKLDEDFAAAQQRLSREIDALRRLIRGGDDGTDPDSILEGVPEALYAWVSSAERLGIHVLAAVTLGAQAPTLDELSTETEFRMAVLRRNIPHLPPALRLSGLEALDGLQLSVLGANGLITLQQRRLDNRFAILAAVSGSRVFNDRFVTAVQAEVADLRSSVADTSATARVTTANRIEFLVMLGAFGAVVTLVILAYVLRGPLRRMRLLVAAIEAHLGGTSVPLPTDGDDEVADIARALAYLIAVISQREASLRASEERLLRQNSAMRDLAQLGLGQEGEVSARLAILVHRATLTLDVDQVGVWLRDGQDSQIFRCSVRYDHGDRPEGYDDTAFDLQRHGVFLRSVFDGRILSVPDLAMRGLGLVLPDGCGAAAGATALLAAAVTIEGEFLGFVLCFSRDGKRSWTADEASFAGGLASHVELALIERDRRATEDALRRAKDAAETALAELRRTQENLVQAEKMASLGQLVAGVAHEVNTPVGINLSAASQIVSEVRQLRDLVSDGKVSRRIFDDALQTLNDLADLMMSNSRRAADLIQSFKNVAVDQSSGDRRRFNLRDYIDEVLISLGPKLKGGNCSVSVTCPADLVLDSYPGALSQILTNLLLNSLAHAFAPDQRGQATIHARLVDDDQIELIYRDTGRGIPMTMRPHIFDPFFTTKRGQGGSGLGLHIVYNLITATLQGSIIVAGEEEQGACFILRFPRCILELVPPVRAP